MLRTESIHWRGRGATRLANGVVELIILTDGGHLAEFRFISQDSFPSQNVLWDAPWMVFSSDNNQLEEQSQTGGFTGHAICLDYFGAPSPDEAVAGLPIHGEAAAERWNVRGSAEEETAACQWNVQLPAAQLGLERKIHLRRQESAIFVEETVHNQRNEDHACHWVQHVTFAPPFLNPGESTLQVSATSGITCPLDYEGGSLIALDREFLWPHAPIQNGDGATVDLSRPFAVKGRGFLAAVQLDPQRKLRLGVGYCFRRSDFPWMALWEENCARPGEPWNGSSQARGMEFGTTPLPLGREETFRRGETFGTPTWCVIPARGAKTARYLSFLFTIPDAVQSIQSVEASGNAILFFDTCGQSRFSIPAYGCEDFLASRET
jgi:hypothetical protein